MAGLNSSINNDVDTCKNCGARLKGNFCHECGQKAGLQRITLLYLLKELIHALTHADKGILFLIREMCYRPGYVAKEYVEDKRSKYFNPLTFFVIVAAIFAIMALKSGYFQAMNSYPTPKGGSLPQPYSDYLAQSIKLLVNNGKIISLIIMVPVLTFLSWTLFRKSGYNFAETLVLQALMLGQVHLSMIVIFIPAYLLFGEPRLNNFIFQITFFLYMVVSYWQFFNQTILVTILKVIAVQLLFIILFWLLMAGIVIMKIQLGLF